MATNNGVALPIRVSRAQRLPVQSEIHHHQATDPLLLTVQTTGRLASLIGQRPVTRIEPLLAAIAAQAVIIRPCRLLEPQLKHFLQKDRRIETLVVLRARPAIIQAQADPAVLFARVAIVAEQLALGQLQATLRRLLAIPGHTEQHDGIDQRDQTEASHEEITLSTLHCPTPANSPWRLRKRRSTSRISTAIKPSSRKNRYLGNSAHHQSNSLV